MAITGVRGGTWWDDAEGAPRFLYSGEFHYFRVPRRDWRERMRLFRAAGGNCLATYVPWLLHEPAEGRFRFGEDDPRLDVDAFLATAHEEGLAVCVRPGPYQYTELRHDGLPPWLSARYPELLARRLDGTTIGPGKVSYLHPVFLAKARTWFAAVVPRLARHRVDRGGPVTLAQIDNELGGVIAWTGSIDYHPEAWELGREGGRWARFLGAVHGDVAGLNAAWDTAYRSLAAAEPVAPHGAATFAAQRRVRDCHRFWLEQLAEYGQLLVRWFDEEGLTVPVVHNAPNPRHTPWYRPLVRRLGQRLVLGVDHYYTLDQSWPQNNPTPQYAASCLRSLELLRLMGHPPTVFELPGGSLSDWPPILPADADACYRLHLALGMKGLNYYIFTGGPNVGDTGTTGTVYDFGAAVAADGTVRPLYEVQRRLGAELAAEPWLAAAARLADVRILLDWEQPMGADTWRSRAGLAFSPADAWTFVQQGIVTTALCAGLSPAFVDGEDDAWTVDVATPLVVPAGPVVSRAVQERLIRFLDGGGHLLLAPCAPWLDEHLRPCTLLADRLGACRLGPVVGDEGRPALEGGDSISLKGGGCFPAEALPADVLVLGTDLVDGRPVAWEHRLPGGGRAVVLSLWWRHAMRAHEAMLRALTDRLGVAPLIEKDDPNVWCSALRGDGRTAVFLMNLHASPLATTVAFRDPADGRRHDLGRHELAPMEVRRVMVAG